MVATKMFDRLRELTGVCETWWHWSPGHKWRPVETWTWNKNVGTCTLVLTERFSFTIYKIGFWEIKITPAKSPATECCMKCLKEKNLSSDITSRLDRLITINGFLYLIFVCVYLCFNSFQFEFVFKVCTIIDWWLMMRCFVQCGYLFLVLLVTQSWKGSIRNLSFDWATIIESLSNQRYQTSNRIWRGDWNLGDQKLVSYCLPPIITFWFSHWYHWYLPVILSYVSVNTYKLDTMWYHMIPCDLCWWQMGALWSLLSEGLVLKISEIITVAHIGPMLWPCCQLVSEVPTPVWTPCSIWHLVLAHDQCNFL